MFGKLKATQSRTRGKVIHLKYYKHLKEATQHSYLGKFEWTFTCKTLNNIHAKAEPES